MYEPGPVTADGREVSLEAFDENYSGYIDQTSPRSCYPTSKRTTETLCASYYAQYGLHTVIVRPCHTYGPGITDSDSRANVQFFRNVLNGEDIVLKSAGSQMRSYSYIADCASVIITCLLNGDPGQAYNSANPDARITLKLIGEDGLYTNLALLLSDQCETTTKVALFQGTDKVLFRDRKEFTGSILKQLEDVYQFIDLVNKTKATFSGLDRTDWRDYPEEAVREALLNSIVHRDYSFSGSNLVNVYEDRIEFVSLGGLVSGLELKSIFLGVSQSRNPNLAAVFYRMRLIESYGTGIGKIERAYKTCPFQPEFETAKGVFRVTLPNRNEEQNNEVQVSDNADEDISLNEQKQLIVQYAQENGSITRKEVEDLIGAGTTKAFRLLKELCEAGKLEQKGNGRLSTYVTK